MKLFYQEVDKARERIGTTTDQAMAWLLRFSQEEVPQMSAGDFLNLQFELVALETYGPPIQATPVFGIPPKARFHDTSLDQYDRLPNRDEVENFRSWLSQTLEGILKKENMIMEMPPVNLRLLYDDDYYGENQEIHPGWFLAESSNGPCTRSYRLIVLIAHVANKIRRCPECHKVFLADRRNKEYCTARCQSRVATRRFRNEHGLITGRKRGRPPRKEEQPGAKKTATKGTRTRGGTDGKKTR